MLIVPAFYLQAGRLVRPTPFWTADSVLGGSVIDATHAFLAKTTARTFYLIDVDGGAASSIQAAADVLAAGAAQVLLEGGIDEVHACVEIAQRGIHPVASERMLTDAIEDSASAVLLGRLPVDVLLGLRGEDEQLFERAARGVERGIFGIVHHSTNPRVALELDRRCGQLPVYLREPAAAPGAVEEVMAHHRRLYAGGARKVIVDAEWYVDYNTMNQPFDLLQ